MIDTPFTVLTAVGGPAILTNACSVLALGTSNRIARVVDRSRALVATLATLDPGSTAHARRHTELLELRSRSHLLVQALRVVYAALGGFASSALISVIGMLTAYYDQATLAHVVAGVGVVIGFLAVAGLVIGCSLMVAETTIAVKAVRNDLEEALSADTAR